MFADLGLNKIGQDMPGAYMPEYCDVFYRITRTLLEKQHCSTRCRSLSMDCGGTDRRTCRRKRTAFDFSQCTGCVIDGVAVQASTSNHVNELSRAIDCDGAEVATR